MSQLLPQARLAIRNSPQFAALTETMHGAVQLQLAQSKALFFSDLSDAEKLLMIDRAAVAIKDNAAYKALLQSASTCLDEALSREVAQQLQAGTATASKSSLLVGAAAEACGALLRLWPDQIKRIRMLLNQAMPMELRRQAWAAVFANPKVRQDFVNSTASAASRLAADDIRITQRCESLLSGTPALAAALSSSNTFVMKSALAFRQASSGALSDADYFLAAPLVLVFGPSQHLSSTEAAAAADVASILQRFVDLHPLRGFTEAQLEGVFAAVLLHIKSADVALHAALETALGAVAKELAASCSGMLRTLFADTLSLECTCFVWDQHAIGLTSTKFDFVPFYAAAVFLSLRDVLAPCTTAAAFRHVFTANAPLVSVRQLQYHVQQFFLPSLQAQLAKDESFDAFPVLDPTAALAAVPPWTRWSTEQAAPRMPVAERAQAREAQESDEQRRTIERIRAEAEARRLLEHTRLQREQDQQRRLLLEQSESERLLAEEQRKTEAIRAAQETLARKVADERRLREDVERRIMEEERSLAEERRRRQELEEAQRQKTKVLRDERRRRLDDGTNASIAVCRATARLLAPTPHGRACRLPSRAPQRRTGPRSYPHPPSQKSLLLPYLRTPVSQRQSSCSCRRFSTLHFSTGTVADPGAPPHDAAMEAAFAMAHEALEVGEVAVGCVVVRGREIIARGRNATNATKNGTRHAELEAIDALVAQHGHARATELLRDIDLYVTVEPCIMCAAALRIVGIRRVFYGCVNERFGGCGSVLPAATV